MQIAKCELQITAYDKRRRLAQGATGKRSLPVFPAPRDKLAQHQNVFNRAKQLLIKGRP